MLCSKSQVVAGLRQTGPVHVAYRIWARCRSLTPGSWPLAWNRWSQSPVVIGSRAVTAADVAATIVSLVTSNPFVTGEVVVVDGGYSATI